MTPWRCRHCIHKEYVNFNGRSMVFCRKRNNYPSPKFIEAWGCDDYVDNSLDLFREEEDDEEK